MKTVQKQILDISKEKNKEIKKLLPKNKRDTKQKQPIPPTCKYTRLHSFAKHIGTIGDNKYYELSKTNSVKHYVFHNSGSLEVAYNVHSLTTNENLASIAEHHVTIKSRKKLFQEV
jgi:hypothetical protein